MYVCDIFTYKSDIWFDRILRPLAKVAVSIRVLHSEIESQYTPQ